MNAMHPEPEIGTSASSTSLGLCATPAQIALDYARAGIPVFPCKPDKTPYTGHGFKDATTDPAKVDALWQAKPGALIGIPTGQASGLYVVDLDTDKETGEALGETTLAALGLSNLLTGPGAMTPSGGRHLYFRDPGLGSTAKRLGPGIDTRGEGGYVIAPGSIAPAGAYVGCNGPLMPETLPALAEALFEALHGPPKAKPSAFRIDTGAGMGWAETGTDRAEVAEVQEVLDHIPPDCGYCDWLAVLMGLHEHFIGSPLGLSVADTWSAKGGKYRPGEVAVKWKGFKLEGGATWAGACALAHDNGADLSAIVNRHRGRNDWESAKTFSGAAGGSEPRADQGAGDGTKEPPERKLPTPFQWRDPATLPPRPWLYGRHLLRGQVSVTVAPGGVGKSSHSIVEALAMVSGRELLGEWTANELKVSLFNLEDPLDELDRRITAAMLHHDVDRSEVEGRLFYDSGRERPLCVAVQGKDGVKIVHPVFSDLAAQIEARGIDVVIVDPFVSSHQVDENGNGAIDLVAKEWARLATRSNCAIELVHHTRKTNGAEASTEDARGATALLGAARSGRVLNKMNDEMKRNAGVLDDACTYFAVDRDKANLAPSGKRIWRRMASYLLPNGDAVGVAETWEWPDTFDGITAEDLLKVQNAIDGRYLRYSDQAGRDWVGCTIADTLGLNPNTDRRRIKRMIETWLKSGAMVKCQKEGPQRKTVPTVEVGEWATG